MPALHPEHTSRNANKFRISIIDFPFASSSNTARHGTVPDRLFLKHCLACLTRVPAQSCLSRTLVWGPANDGSGPVYKEAGACFPCCQMRKQQKCVCGAQTLCVSFKKSEWTFGWKPS